MIYLRLHQARNEEIDPGASRRKQGQAGKFRYSSEILSSLFLCTNDPVLVNFISTLTKIILFRLDWYFHLFVRLYKPFFWTFCNLIFNSKHTQYGPLFSAFIFSLLSPLSLTF